MGKPEEPAKSDNTASSSRTSKDDGTPETFTQDARQVASETDATKSQLISQACRDHDIPALVRLADTEGGLLNDALRKDAWPLLLGCKESPAEQGDWEDLPKHRDEEQVELDVNRAFVYYPNVESEKDLDTRREALSNLIVRTLRKHNMLCYFQGYHDIVQVMLLVLGEFQAVQPVARLSLLRIRDYMLPSLTPAVKHLQLLPALLDRSDRELCQHLAHTKPYFALASTLTLYAHDVQDYKSITRLYDFLLAHEPVVAIYLFAAVIIQRKDELLEIPPDDPDMLHFTLTKLPQTLNLESLISKTLELFQDYPPSTLPYGAWRRISSYSVLKTSKDLDDQQCLETGENYFRKQAQQLRFEEAQQRIATQIWRHRRPVSRVFFAVLIGAFSIWLRRSGNDKFMLYSILRAKDVVSSWIFD